MDDSARMDARLSRRIAEKRKKLDEYRPLDQGIVQRLHEDFRVEATYHSNALEGNTLTLAETEMVLAYGMTIAGHPLREHLEVTNHAKAYDVMERLIKHPIDMETVLFLHRLVKAQIDAGVDSVNDGEQSKTSYSTYVRERLNGFEGNETELRPVSGDAREFRGWAGDRGPGRRADHSHY